MSAAANVKNNWATIILTWVLSMVTAFAIFAANKAEMEELYDEAKITGIEEKIASKASKKELADAIKAHEEKEQLIIDGIKEVVSTGNEHLEKILNLHYKSIEKRLDKIERK